MMKIVKRKDPVFGGFAWTVESEDGQYVLAVFDTLAEARQFVESSHD